MVGVTTTLALGGFLNTNDCYLHTDHHRGRGFFARSYFQFLVFSSDFTHRSGNSLPFGMGAGGVKGAQTCGAEIIPTYPTNILHIVSGILVALKIFVC